jgi:hypothetical protein
MSQVKMVEVQNASEVVLDFSSECQVSSNASEVEVDFLNAAYDTGKDDMLHQEQYSIVNSVTRYITSPISWFMSCASRVKCSLMETSEISEDELVISVKESLLNYNSSGNRITNLPENRYGRRAIWKDWADANKVFRNFLALENFEFCRSFLPKLKEMITSEEDINEYNKLYEYIKTKFNMQKIKDYRIILSGYAEYLPELPNYDQISLYVNNFLTSTVNDDLGNIKYLPSMRVLEQYDTVVREIKKSNYLSWFMYLQKVDGVIPVSCLTNIWLLSVDPKNLLSEVDIMMANIGSYERDNDNIQVNTIRV